MKTRNSLRNKKAVQDLDSIWAYMFKTWSEKRADEYYSALVETFATIAKRPCHLDKEYIEIHPGLYRRSLLCLSPKHITSWLQAGVFFWVGHSQLLHPI